MNLQAKLQQQFNAMDSKPDCDFESDQLQVPSLDIDTEKAPLDVVPSFAITLAEAKERIKMLYNFVKEVMVLGQDFGVVPGIQKPTLLKPGAEKLCDIFGFSKQVEIINRVEDWEKGLFAYEVKVSLTNKRNGLVEAEGIGCCNTREKKYRSQDPYNVINTVLKMAKKRALIDAVLSATRSSGIFTQDVEDLELTQIQKEPSLGPSASIQSSTPIITSMATKPQIRKIQALASDLQIQPRQLEILMKDMCGVGNINNLTKGQASSLIEYMLTLQ